MFNIFESLVNVDVGGVNVTINLSKADVAKPTNVDSTSSKSLVLLIVGFFMVIAHKPESVEEKITELTPNLKGYNYGQPEGHVRLRLIFVLEDFSWVKIR